MKKVPTIKAMKGSKTIEILFIVKEHEKSITGLEKEYGLLFTNRIIIIIICIQLE